MSLVQIRNWLGVFFLGATALIGAYILLFQETVALPIPADDATSAFQIIIPTFIAQLTVIFKWISHPPTDSSAVVTIPKWAVAGPPLCVALILVAAVVLLVIDQGRTLKGGPLFKNAVTFCVSILSASTVFIVTRVFAEVGKQEP